jgi:hypothetical protein
MIRRRGTIRRRARVGLLGLVVSAAASAWAQQQSPTVQAPAVQAPAVQAGVAVAAVGTVGIDRIAVRFSAPEMGGVDYPRFIFARVLAFEARLEALADGAFRPSDAGPYTDQHLEAALERHVAETILEGLDVSPAPSPADIAARVQSARLSIAVRAGGAQALDRAAQLEGLEPHEVLRIVQRHARASLYLDRMVAPMLEPSDPELRGIHQSGRTPFSKQPFEEAEPALRRWYVARRLREAVLNYYEGSRFRVQVTVL